jgi:hypothetical protein
MAKRLRDVCGLAESEPLWHAGRGFVIRDLPWTVEKLRVIPPFEFENWAVIALGGIPNKVQVGDMGVDAYPPREQMKALHLTGSEDKTRILKSKAEIIRQKQPRQTAGVFFQPPRDGFPVCPGWRISFSWCGIRP